jgi:nicotinamidase-related amidase
MKLSVEQSVLVIVDVQGKLASLMYHEPKLVAAIETLIRAAKLFELPILWVEQLPNKLGATATPIVELMAELYPENLPVCKSSFSALGSIEFRQQLSELGRRQVILTGIESHVCVFQTARDLVSRSYQVFPVIDAISSRTQANYQLGLSRMEQLGACLTSVEMLLFELQQVAEGERFRQMIRLIS